MKIKRFYYRTNTKNKSDITVGAEDFKMFIVIIPFIIYYRTLLPNTSG